MIRGAICDFDGTLFDSMSVWETAGEVYLRSAGCEPERDLQKVLKPMSLLQAAGYLKRSYQLSLTEEEIAGGVNSVVEDFYLHTVQPKPGMGACLEKLQAWDVKMCIATAASRYQVEAALRRCGMERFFTEILTCTAVGCGKDEPIIFREALRRLQTGRRDTIVVEDALHAIRTAKEDGFITVGVYDAYEDRQREMRTYADFFLGEEADWGGFWRFIAQIS